MSELTVDELYEENAALLRRVVDLGNSLSFVQITNDILRQSLLVALRSEQEMRTTLTAAQQLATKLAGELRDARSAAAAIGKQYLDFVATQ